MTKQKPYLLAAIVAIVLLLVASACTPADLQALEGILQNVDMVSGNVTVKLKDGTIKTFNFTDVKVDTIRQALGSASLEIGDQITVRANKNGQIKGLEVKKADIEGTIKSINTDNVTITAKKGDITLIVTAETVIKIEEKGKATLSDLKVGQNVEAKYDVSSMKALRLTVDTGEEDDEKDEHGTIKGTGTDNRTGNRINTDNRTGPSGKGGRNSSVNNRDHEKD